MKTWEKMMLLISLPFAIFWHGVKNADKYMKRKLKPAVAMLVATALLLSVIPLTAFADTDIDHTTHAGCKALSMGETYIMVDGVEQSDNRLSDGNYYLTGDISVTLSINGKVSLCLNGFSVNTGNSRGIEFYTSDLSLTVDDCVGTGQISGGRYAIYVGRSNTTVTVNSGTVGNGSCTYGIYTSNRATLYINGGSVIGQTHGIHNSYENAVVYLSGSPTVSGGTADIYDGMLYADNGAEPPVPYSGDTLKLDGRAFDYHYHGDVMVSHVTETNKELFVSTPDIPNFSLVYDSAANALKLEGEPMALTWYAEDGATVLSGPDYPTAVHYGEKISDMPVYEKEGYFFLGWLWRSVGDDAWSYEYYGENEYDTNEFRNPTEFKAVILSKHFFAGDGMADAPYLIQNVEDLLTMAQLVHDNFKQYNAETVYYQLTADLDLSSVCGEEKGNWTPIGKQEGFSAQFDGNGHTVSNLYYKDVASCVGLFGILHEKASIRNLTVTGFISASNDFSGIVGRNDNGKVENCLDLTKTVPYGYTTDENGWMAFTDPEGLADVDVKAFYDGNWIQTTYNDLKYKVTTAELDGAKVTVTPTIINGGAYVKMLYTVTNNGDTAITNGKLAVHSDIQIGDNDKAAIEIIRDGDGKAIGFRMVDDHLFVDEKGNPTNCASRGAQLNLYFAGTGGVTNADTYWFGHYSDKEDHAFETIADKTASIGATYEKDENGNYIKLSDVDSGIAFSWQNIELAAGESKEFSWVINVGTEADPPQWSDYGVNLTVTADATQHDLDINVAAKVKDAAGVTDKLYYAVNNGAGVLLGGVIADGVTEKSITGVINASTWANGTYDLDFWVINSKGAVSEKVRRTLTVQNGRVTGDITVLNPELSHNWESAWNYDETNHWHNCQNSNCTISENAEKNGFGAHEFDSPCDATCNTCGYTRAITHTFNQKVMTEQYLASAGTCTQRAKYYYSCTCGAAGTTTFFGDTAPHEYAYSAEGAVITETCTGDCGHKATATLVAPKNLTYDGTAKKATVSYSENWKGSTLPVAYGSHGNVNAGTVTAGITKNNKTAVLSYDITAATAIVTPPTAKENLVYNGSTNALVNAGTTTGGTLQYAIGTSTTIAPTSGWHTAIPAGKNAGTYDVWYKVVGGTNYHSVAPVCITVTVAKASITVTADNKTKTYGDNEPAFTWRVTAGTVQPNDTLAGINVSRAGGENVGNYTIAITQTAGANPNYDITFANGTLTVVQKEIGIRWSNTSLIYNGLAQKPTATATGTVNGDQITLMISGAQVNASDTAYPAAVVGIEGTKAANYKLPAEKVTAFTIAKAGQAAPTGIGQTNETISGKADGTLTGLTAAMEYRKDGVETYTGVNSSIIENLAAGKYYVRIKGDSNHLPSAETAITITAGRKLKIVVPAQQIGYTLAATAYEMDYLGAATLTFTLAEGYSKAANFAILLNGNPNAAWQNGQLPLSDIITDVNITVDGVADITAPTAEIQIKDNKWTSFLHLITFGLFFKETQNVTITADDKGSGVDKIQYYVSEEELTYDSLSHITDWKDYNGAFALNPNHHYVVYAKVTDKSGNTRYISSDGLVFDSVAPAFYGIENGGVYYGDTVIRVVDEQHYPITFTMDGVDVTDKISNNEYTITADNKEHTLVATDKAGNVTAYKITVYKNYTVTYKINGETIGTETVGHGKDATLPVIPAKEGYDQTAPIWDKNGKAITADTEIHAVYTVNEYTITFMAENGVYKTLTYKHGETVTMPTVPTKDGYTVQWETTIDKAMGDATVKAVYNEIPATEKPNSPQTGDTANLWLWVALLFVSSIAIITQTVYSKKEKSRETK